MTGAMMFFLDGVCVGLFLVSGQRVSALITGCDPDLTPGTQQSFVFHVDLGSESGGVPDIDRGAAYNKKALCCPIGSPRSCSPSSTVSRFCSC